ncbi:MAG: hypothetical protein M3452_09795 [Chloroflexota bacterium]|nr:hypothetical protein [Chloroflexota bacterium]
MYARDRLLNVSLLLAAVAAWLAVAWLLTSLSPRDDPRLQAAAALLLGVAVAVTLLPLFWLASFARRHRIAYRGDWSRAGRRALLTGAVVTVLLLLRVLGAFSMPIGAFVVAMALFIELIATARR